MKSNDSKLVTQKEFADLFGCAKSYVTKLKQDGRLVMVNGKVDVKASKARIQETSDENRSDVVDRWAEYRDGDESETAEQTNEAISQSFNAHRTEKMRYDAQKSRLEFERESGKLVEVEQVKQLASHAGTTLRQHLERLPDRMATELAAEKDRERIHAMLVERIEEALNNMSMEVRKGLEAMQP